MFVTTRTDALKIVESARELLVEEPCQMSKAASGPGDEYERLRTVHLRAEEAGRKVASETTRYVLKLDQKDLHQLQEASGPRFADNLESANHPAGLRVPSPDTPSWVRFSPEAEGSLPRPEKAALSAEVEGAAIEDPDLADGACAPVGPEHTSVWTSKADEVWKKAAKSANRLLWKKIIDLDDEQDCAALGDLVENARMAHASALKPYLGESWHQPSAAAAACMQRTVQLDVSDLVRIADRVLDSGRPAMLALLNAMTSSVRRLNSLTACCRNHTLKNLIVTIQLALVNRLDELKRSPTIGAEDDMHSREV
ncbi:uncharacterized protein EV422DRAFT_580964 [Fimicolochytrium jonesii]|uniref:uncharacterized protein n=1 Tax=Fimicolochytrium jonesii TaxID=1396493 RepID=UPI0022FEB4BD|nr:uncharacterized protein EV422DRAFT_580964 [Fimicolochytrium jonesii]KAI8817209.1 hypothetical protein EV422DRAFT_580964 [Fimicolochytrium jonesii]